MLRFTNVLQAAEATSGGEAPDSVVASGAGIVVFAASITDVVTAGSVLLDSAVASPPASGRVLAVGILP